MDLNGILIGSEDPTRLTEYYTKVFGPPGMNEGGFASWEIGTGWFAVGAHDQVHGPNAHPGRLIWNISSADVPGDFARMRDAGATVVQEPYHPGEGAEEGANVWIATLSDPDDNYFQLISPM